MMTISKKSVKCFLENLIINKIEKNDKVFII